MQYLYILLLKMDKIPVKITLKKYIKSGAFTRDAKNNSSAINEAYKLYEADVIEDKNVTIK